jgi:hypothetical protein
MASWKKVGEMGDGVKRAERQAGREVEGRG